MAARCLFKRLHHVKHAEVLPRAKVDCMPAGGLRQNVQCGSVPLGQAHHMNIIPDARSIFLIATEDFQYRSLTGGNLSDAVHEVAGHAIGVLAKQATCVSTHWVEIT